VSLCVVGLLKKIKAGCFYGHGEYTGITINIVCLQMLSISRTINHRTVGRLVTNEMGRKNKFY
jgi:hypothetical protein